MKAHYQRGGLGDVKVKKFLNSVMQAELEPIRTRRKEWEQRLPEVVEILKEGSAYAEKDCRCYAGRGAQVHADRLLLQRQPVEMKSMRVSGMPQVFRTLFYSLRKLHRKCGQTVLK